MQVSMEQNSSISDLSKEVETKKRPHCTVAESDLGISSENSISLEEKTTVQAVEETISSQESPRKKRHCGPEDSSLCKKSSSGVDESLQACQNEVIDPIDTELKKPTNQEPVKELCSSAGFVGRKKLLILDVNGLLADIVANPEPQYMPDAWIGIKAVFKRAFCSDFLEFCFDNFEVGVWSSRNRKNLERSINYLMGDKRMKLLFCWDQSHCTDTGYKTIEDENKPLFLKEIRKLWDKEYPNLPWEKGDYNESNTILIDDSPYKALLNPLNTGIFPYPYEYKVISDNLLGRKGKLRLYLERLVKVDDVQKFVLENPFGQEAIKMGHESWATYSKIFYDVCERKGVDPFLIHSSGLLV